MNKKTFAVMSDDIKFSREWAMPSADTFSITPIKRLIERYLVVGQTNIDPFVRNSPFKNWCHSNDLDPAIQADCHKDAHDFLSDILDLSADLVLFDPPYSVRQVSECYRALGKTVNAETTRADYWTKLKTQIARIVKVNGTVISFGWNSGGIGKKLGFSIIEVLLVAHGGIHNDTICVVERKMI